MPTQKAIFKILRYRPGHIEPPRFEEFTLDLDPEASVLDGLEKIRLEQDNTLMYRHSCHHSSCGTCACKLNGKERLTCITKIRELEGRTITLTPFEGFKPIGDLAVDMTRFFADFEEDWKYLKTSEDIAITDPPQGIRQFTRLENCIECGACVSACPVIRKNQKFLGPAVLSALHNELEKSPQKSKELLLLAAKDRGVRLCERVLDCSRVCPTAVYPAWHIADLRRLLEKKNLNKLFD